MAGPSDSTSAAVSFTKVNVCPRRDHFLKASYMLCGPALAFLEKKGHDFGKRTESNVLQPDYTRPVTTPALLEYVQWLGVLEDT